MKSLFLAAMFLALPAAASDFSARYPAGSVRDAQQAQAALKDADAEMAHIASHATSREAECYRGILVNSCRDDVRREKELAEREVRRVRVEARDLQRRLDAEDLAKRRAEKSAASAAKEAGKPTEQKPARAAPAPATRDPNGQAAGGGERPRPTQEKLSAAQRAENARKFQQKQAQAAKRAQEREDERTKNEERRAEKRKQMEQREAEREAIRRKAAELEKKL